MLKGLGNGVAAASKICRCSATNQCRASSSRPQALRIARTRRLGAAPVSVYQSPVVSQLYLRGVHFRGVDAGLQHVCRGQTRGFTAAAGDHVVVAMPALSPTMTTGKIAKWMIKPGDSMAAGDVLFEVETDKAVVSYEVQDEGVLAKILVSAGDVDVPVGAPIAVTVEDATAYAAFVAADKSAGGTLGAARKAAESSPAGTTSAPEESNHATASGGATNGAARFAPSARHMADSMHIDASGLAGTGRGGRITKEDLVIALRDGKKFPPSVSNSAEAHEAVSTKTSAPASTSTPPPVTKSAEPGVTSGADSAKAVSASSDVYKDVPANNIRKVIAKRLAQSKATVPHFYVSVECELDAALSLRKVLATKHDAKVSVNDLVIRSAALALRDVPEANALWDSVGSAPKLQSQVDVSVAVATPTGLITPIVTAADRRGLADISTAVKELAGKAKAGTLQLHEFQGGTFTVSNLGMFGIDEFSAVINPPQACIMAVGGGSRRVVPGLPSETGEKAASPRIATIMTARLSCDRRVVDEAIAGQFLQAFRHYMQKPELMLL